MTEFQAFVEGEPEPNLFDVDPIEDTANPFADFCVLKIDDTGGEKFAKYGRGTRIDVEILPDPQAQEDLTIDSGETFETTSGDTDTFTQIQNAGTYQNAGTVQTTGEDRIQKFTGFVVERRELDQDGADVLEVEAYTFDQFLRKAEVKSDLRDKPIADALETIINEIDAVSFNAALIDVGDNQTLTRSYRGDPVETVIRDLAFKSVNEEFGVTEDLEFFFRPRETTHIDRGIDNTQWFGYDIPELGKEAVNEVEVFFDDGDRSVVVDNGTDKLDLQNSLDLPGPGTQKVDLNLPAITNAEDAEDEGRKFLEFRNATLTGTVTTFGLFDAEPGDTINIEIDERGIDDEFVIAGLKYTWGVDETRLTIVENRGENNAEFLFRINESLKRLELADVDRDGPQDRITSTDVSTSIDLSADIDGTATNRERFTNVGRNLVRDGWRGEPVDIDTLAVGTSNAGLSRSNTELREQVATDSVSTTLDGDTGVTFDATFTQSDIQEVGLFDGDVLVARLTTDEPVAVDGSVSVSFDVDNDADVTRGVITDSGQEAIRDILADNTPDLPNFYAYGSDITEPAVTDTALENEVIEISLDEILIQSANTQETWEEIVEPPADVPLVVDGGELRTTEINKIVNSDQMQPTGGSIFEEDDFEGGRGRGIRDVDDGTPDSLTRTVSFEYDVENPQFEYRLGDGNASGIDNGPPFEIFIDGNRVEGFTSGFSELSFGWRTAFVTEPIEAGSSVEIRIEIDADNWDENEDYDHAVFDLWALYDNDFTFDFQETLDEPGGRLERPSTHPELVETSLATATTRRNVTQANFESSWNNTDNEQYVELANDETNFTRFNNSDSGLVEFAEPDASVDTNIGLSRFSDGEDRTPLLGNSGQSVSLWELFADPEAITPDNTGVTNTRVLTTQGQLEGQTIQEAGQKSDATLLTRSIFPEFDIGEDTTVISAERTEFKL